MDEPSEQSPRHVRFKQHANIHKTETKAVLALMEAGYVCEGGLHQLLFFHFDVGPPPAGLDSLLTSFLKITLYTEPGYMWCNHFQGS